MKSTELYLDNVKKLKAAIEEADAVIIGAGAGLSTSAGFIYNGKRFSQYFQDFIDEYHFNDMYEGGFYNFSTKEEFWGYWSRFIYVNRYLEIPSKTYDILYNLVKDKEYFVLTTNVDHCFQRSGFDKNHLFYTQGDYGLFQCSVPCTQDTYDNFYQIKKMYNAQENRKIPTSLIPKCPICGADMTTNLRSDDKFVEDAGWHAASKRYLAFIEKYKTAKVLYLELGVGHNTPGIIKFPFWKMVYQNNNATYACINYQEAYAPSQIADRSIIINDDIRSVLIEVTKMKNKEINDIKEPKC